MDRDERGTTLEGTTSLRQGVCNRLNPWKSQSTMERHPRALPVSGDAARVFLEATNSTMGPGYDGSSPIVIKKGRRKQGIALESVQSIGDSFEELKSKVNMGASSLGDRDLERCTLILRESTEKAAKVKRLEDPVILDDSLREGTKTARPVVMDTIGDFCDNIFGDLQSIVNLHPEENGILSEVPNPSGGENEGKIEMQAGVNFKVGSRKEETVLINITSRSAGLEESVGKEISTPITVHETTLKFSKGSETIPVVSDPQEEGASKGSNNTSKGGQSNQDARKSIENDGEDSSSVTSRDNVTTASKDRDRKGTSVDNKRAGVSKSLSKASVKDVHMSSKSEVLVDKTIHIRSRKGMPIRSEEPHKDDDHVGCRSSSEAKISRVSPSKSRTLALSSQVSVNGNDVSSSSILEGRATLQITSEVLRSDGEGMLRLGKKSDSLKSVNQEIRVCDSDAAGAVKVESSIELTRSLSRHTGNTAGGEDDSSGVTEGDENTTSEKVDESVSISSNAGWVKCDDCNKWRSIPVEIAEKIGDTNAYWSCKENPNKRFADCSIPQVKSNEEINRDLGISESSSCDEEDDVDAACDSKPTYSGRQQVVTVNSQAYWKEIKRNIFKHRKQKHQDADEAMVCQCAPPKPGEVGCGEDCLNRILNVECLPQQCPCGSLCTNQQFQKREYAKVALFRCGKKGHGLQAKEHIPKGSFVIEYVGEVLDMPSFEVRQKEYAMNSQKHFYFMTLSANEVIDACSKGNYGRFINHSCEPNCQTEKWMVDGEVCIGLFAIRDVKKGEEITFDYNFVRVGGADAKKCECGANKCRGFIGVEPDTPQNVLEIDSDDGEDPEPIMLQVDSDDEFDDYLDKTKEGVPKKRRMILDRESMNDNNWKLGGVKRKSYSGGAKDMKNPKRSRRVKTAATSKIGNLKPAPPRLFSGSRFGIRNKNPSDVESKLGELTNDTGGLRKLRDTAKQYLKLLVLATASGGNVNGTAACSARDLSMLLEALLKTQRSSLLKDIMDKNGLQMFHNLIKQLRMSFEKRPILRKLMKVLDHLAKYKVLTAKHIYSSPRSGTECFSDTLFDLSKHDDTEVQHMARNFRKLYVPPRPHKAIINMERPLMKSPVRQTSVSLPVVESPHEGSSASYPGDQAHAVHGGRVEGNAANPATTSRRKRPSRWDTVADTGAAVLPSGPSGMPSSAPHCDSSKQASSSVTHRSNQLLTSSASLQAPKLVRSDISQRSSVPIQGPLSGSSPPVRHMVQGGGLQVYRPGHIPAGLPVQRQAIPLLPIHLPMQRGAPSVHPSPYAFNQGQVAPSVRSSSSVQWSMMHGAPFPPLPPSGRPAWTHNGPRQMDGFPGHASGFGFETLDANKGLVMKWGYSASQSSALKTEAEKPTEPPVPGMSPTRPQGSRTTHVISPSAQAPARHLNESDCTRAEHPPHTYKGEHGKRVSGHDSIVANRFRSGTDNINLIQQVYCNPDNCEGRGEREICWDTPECSSFHHHVASMIRSRVEMRHLVQCKDLGKFCSKLTEVVIRKEIKKHKENKIQGMAKVILRSKLLEKVDAYVDLQIGVYSKQKSREGQS